MKADELYILSSRETGREGLYAFNVKSKVLRTVFVHEKVDILKVITEDDSVVGLYFENGLPEIVVLDSDSAVMTVFRNAQKHFPDELVTDIELTQDKKSASFRVSSDRNPGTYYLMDDINVEKFKLLGDSNKLVKEANLGPREPFSFKARDGLEISGYITSPPQAELKEKRPMIVNVHGGPFGIRDSWSYSDEAQFFASRGYVVLEVNYRGSGGYGQKFMEAGWKQYGKAMQDDVTDATRWAIAEGIADPNRICIYGGSYGGYAALQGLVKEPDLYRCGISYVGVSDLTLLGKEGDTSEIRGVDKWMDRTLGSDVSELRKYSPGYNADKIKAPVFIIHGADDRRVPLIHAKRMRDDLVRNNKVFEWMVKDSEGHGFSQPANRIEAYHAMLKFVQKYIGEGKPVR